MEILNYDKNLNKKTKIFILINLLRRVAKKQMLIKSYQRFGNMGGPALHMKLHKVFIGC